jgi:flagellar basal body-associated protein FliL
MEDMRFNTPVKIKPTEVSEEKNKSQSKYKNKRHMFFVILAFVLIIAALGAAAFFYMKYIDVQKIASQSQAAAVAGVSNIIDDVGKLIVLPEDEEPTIATISDVEKLRDQLFFVNAKNGDKVLIYAKAGKAILYDPVEKKIVEVAPINVDNTKN